VGPASAGAPLRALRHVDDQQDSAHPEILKKPEELLAYTFVLIWASGFIVARWAAPHADPLTFLVYRYVLSIAVFVAASLALRVPWPRDRGAWRDALIAGMLIHGVYLGGVFWAIFHGMPAGVTALVTGLHPILTAALAIPLLHEHVTGRQWLGIAVGFAGVGLVVAPAVATVHGVPLMALLSSLIATLGFALGTVWQKRSRPAMDLRVNAAIQFIGALILTAPIAWLLEDGRFDRAPAAFGALAWAVLVLSVGGISLLLFLLKRGAASRVAPLLYVSPPVAAFLAFLLFGEALSAIQIAGAALAIAGAYMARHVDRGQTGV
jgi:drug/metabolite transporter (DMT)-like permease